MVLGDVKRCLKTQVAEGYGAAISELVLRRLRHRAFSIHA